MAWFRRRRKPDAPDLKRVEAYAEPRERRYPEVFVGREAELDLVERICREAIELGKEGRQCEGYTILFQGAPGAGKSALLSHLGKLWEGKKGAPQAMRLNEGALYDPGRTAQKIAERIDPEQAGRFRQSAIAAGAASGGIPAIAQGEASASRETRSAEPDFSRLKEIKPPEKWDRPLCVLIDEIQNVTPDQRVCLGELHSGDHMLPIVPIFAGLANSETVLERAGLSRMRESSIRNLERLSDSEVRSYVEGMLDRCRIGCSPDQLDRIAGDIARSSEGWPQHVHTGTSALFWGLSRAGCDLSRVDFGEVERKAGSYREDSYEQRLSPEMAGSKALMASALKEIPESGAMDRDSVADLIRKNNVPDGPERWRLPQGMDARLYLEHLIRKGVLQPSGRGMLVFPIPSLRSWLIGLASSGMEPGSPPARGREPGPGPA